jgi:hypothetical protein
MMAISAVNFCLVMTTYNNGPAVAGSVDIALSTCTDYTLQRTDGHNSPN